LPGDSAGGQGFRRTIGLFWPLWLLPAVVIGGLVLAVPYAPGPLESFYPDQALPFLIAYWIGLGFTTTWWLISDSLRRDKVSPGIVAAVGILSALLLLSMLGGIELLWEDPWLFGVAIAPGFALARPRLGRWLFARRSRSSVSTSPPSEGPV